MLGSEGTKKLLTLPKKKAVNQQGQHENGISQVLHNRDNVRRPRSVPRKLQGPHIQQGALSCPAGYADAPFNRMVGTPGKEVMTGLPLSYSTKSMSTATMWVPFIPRLSSHSRFASSFLQLEYDTERAGTFESLKHLPKDKVIILGSSRRKPPRRRNDRPLISKPGKTRCSL